MPERTRGEMARATPTHARRDPRKSLSSRGFSVRTETADTRGPQDQHVVHPGRAEREPLELGVIHGRGIDAPLLHEGDVPMDRAEREEPGQQAAPDERDENAAQGIAQDLSKLLRQRILKEFKNKYGGKGPDSLQDGKSVTFNALLEQGKKINITIDSAAFAAWPRTAGPDRPRATRARPAPPPGSAGPAPRVAHEHRSTHTYRRSARGR